jgi:hypothetical protein
MKKPVFQFQTKNSKTSDVQASYSSNQISSNSNVLFLGLNIDNLLTLKDHICALVVKLNRSCFAIQAFKSILSLETLRTAYYSYVYSIVGIVLSSGSPCVGIVPSPSQVVPQCEEITTIHFFMQIFIVCDTEYIQAKLYRQLSQVDLVWSGILLAVSSFYITLGRT